MLITILLIYKTSINAWVYPEHRDISLLAIQNLSPEQYSLLNKLWSEARVGYEFRLTENVIDAAQSVKPLKLDYASITFSVNLNS